jgi:hypothetical protein
MEDENPGGPGPPTLFGATNPFFLKRRRPDLSVVTVAPPQATVATQPNSAPELDRRHRRSSSSKLLPTVSSTAGTLGRALFRNASSNEPDALAADGNGMWLSYEGTCSGPHKPTLAKVQQAAGRSGAAQTRARNGWSQDAILRAHFYELTTAFLAPFCLYCGVFPPWDARAQVRCAFVQRDQEVHAMLSAMRRLTKTPAFQHNAITSCAHYASGIALAYKWWHRCSHGCVAGSEGGRQQWCRTR